MKIKASYLITFVAFIIIVAFYKIPLSTDDYHWAFKLKQGEFFQIFDDYFFRLPVWKIIFTIIFPLNLNYPIFGKLFVWGMGILGLHFPFRWFLNKYGLNPNLLPIIAFLTFFAPNQYEINYFLTITPYCFGFLFCGLGFNAFRKGNRAIGTLFYLLSFLTLESFVVFVILLESSVYFETLTSRVSVKTLIYSLIPLFSSYLAIRLMLHFVNPYHYIIDTHLSLSQVRGLLVQCFFINFYKLNSILSVVQLMLYSYLFVYFFKRAGKKAVAFDWMKKLFILFVILIVSSGYYYLIKYSANRALSSQICYCWGFYLLLCFIYLTKTQKSLLLKVLIALLLISTQISNQAMIYRTKQFNYHFINEKVKLVKEQLSKREKKLIIDLNQITSGLKRDWIFATTKDAELMFKLYLSPKEFSRVSFIN